MFFKKKKESPTDLLSEPREQHYVFAHQGVRQACVDNPLQFFSLMASEEQKPYLAWMWDVCAKYVKNPSKELSVDDVVVTTCRMGPYPAVILRMPEPRAVAEVHYIAAVLMVNGENELPQEDVGIRYFTLECGINLDGTPRTVFCEWTDDDAHLNFGDGPQADVDAFAHAVAGKLSA
ncbi:hypothetical protein UNDKW_4188 [Undibacterium sp. KW1]|nr:hypothetical protein UNDKW_4188 [Undibacterium sp. KW1]